MIIVNSLWARSSINNLKDPTNLGIIAGTFIKLPHGCLLVASVYWPIPSKPDVPSFSDALWRRLQAYLRRTRQSEVDPLFFIQRLIMRIVTTHMSTPGNMVTLSGDFNSEWTTLHRATHPALQPWAEYNLWANGLAEGMDPDTDFHSRWATPERPTSWIDHILHRIPPEVSCVGGRGVRGNDLGRNI